MRQYTREADADIWGGLVTSLGCHGVVTSLTLDLVPDFDVHNYGYARVPAEHFLAHWGAMLAHPDCDSFNAMVHHPVCAPLGRSRALRVSPSKSVLDGAFAWARRALSCRKRYSGVPCGLRPGQFEFVSFGFQRFVPAGSLAEAPAVEPTWHGEGVAARGGGGPPPAFGPFTLHGESGNNVVRWHQALTWLTDAKEAEFQVEYFVPLAQAVGALRAAWALAAERFGEARS